VGGCEKRGKIRMKRLSKGESCIGKRSGGKSAIRGGEERGLAKWG